MHDFHLAVCLWSVSVWIFAYLQLSNINPLFAPASASIAAGELYFRHFQGSVYFLF